MQPTFAESHLPERADRFVIYPINYPHLWELYKRATSAIWLAEDVDLTKDVVHWSTHLTDEERGFLSATLAFFAVSDGIVNENLVQRFSTEVPIPEAKYFYGVQIFMENVHAETYANLLSTLVTEPSKRDLLFSAASRATSIGSKAKWALKWIDNDESFATRLVAFAAVEGIFFSSSFASIFWIKSRGLMPGLCFSNELISRDEGLHTEFACALFQHLKVKPSAEAILQIILDAVRAEKDFVQESLPVKLIGMNAELMSEYVEFVADRLLEMLGTRKYFNTNNPFPFMDLISVDGKANFFERQVSAYSLSSSTIPNGPDSASMSQIKL